MALDPLIAKVLLHNFIQSQQIPNYKADSGIETAFLKLKDLLDLDAVVTLNNFVEHLNDEQIRVATTEIDKERLNQLQNAGTTVVAGLGAAVFAWINSTKTTTIDSKIYYPNGDLYKSETKQVVVSNGYELGQAAIKVLSNWGKPRADQ